MDSFKFFLKVIILLSSSVMLSQDIQLFQQFNGRYDYLAFGNTLNLAENGGDPAPLCEILTESAADYALQPGQTLIAAYLYWAGSGDGDLDVTFNGVPVTAERTFAFELNATYNYFAAFADVTAILQAGGNANYLLSDLDLTAVIMDYCAGNGNTGNATNFGGWAVTVIYEDPILPKNQVNLFDGMEAVSQVSPDLTIELDNLNVLDNEGAKIGFLAWEGDEGLAVNETLRINGNIISNPPLNPADNQFNGTNSFTGSDVLYNMDIDFYDIENNIQPGDTSATIQLTSNQDLVMINNVITVLNTELPDATIVVDNITGADVCGDRDIFLEYTVFNVNSTDELPAGTPIAFYANSTLMGQSQTTMEIPIDGQESGSINLTIPVGTPADFQIRVFVDDDGTGNGTVDETNEDNNFFFVDFHYLLIPEIVGLIDLEECDAVGTELFDLTTATTQIDPVNAISYHLTEDDAQNDVNPIADPNEYENTANPQTIWIRVSNPDCFAIDSFEIEVIICPLPDATISIDNNLNACRKRDLDIEYTVGNIDGTGPLPANTPIAFYVEGALLGQATTQNVIPIGGSEPGTIIIILPDTIPDTFLLLAAADDTGNGLGIVEELNEFNNDFDLMVVFGAIPPIPALPDLLECDTGNDTAFFDLTEQDDLVATGADDIIRYFNSFEDAEANSNPITDPEQYQNISDPETIYVRQDNEICFTVGSFLLTTENCEPGIFEGMSPNDDGKNDVFIIEGLIDVFTDFNLKMYSRDGNLIYEGGNQDGLWDGIPNTGLLYNKTLVPTGTYYYVLQLNDPQFPNPFLGFIYVNY